MKWCKDKNPNDCTWCFDRMKKARIAVYNEVFCSPKCAFSHKEFEDQFRKMRA